MCSRKKNPQVDSAPLPDCPRCRRCSGKCGLQILLFCWAGLLIQPNENNKEIPNIRHDGNCIIPITIFLILDVNNLVPRAYMENFQEITSLISRYITLRCGISSFTLFFLHFLCYHQIKDL